MGDDYTAAAAYGAVGSRLGSYRLDAQIGRGGMAVVYRAHDLRLGRPVALKMIAPELSNNDQFRQRFIRESQLAAATDHPNIIPIYESGEHSGQLFIAMRYVDGSDLRAVLARDRRFSPDRAVDTFWQVASALDAAHGRGLVHRDVKPGNVLLASGNGGEDPGHVYLTDFGLTKRTLSLSGLTTAGHFIGTVAYVAPEQISGKPVDPRADVYSLGCVVFESLAGHPPYQRDDDIATLWAHITANPPALSQERPELSPDVDDIVARAMAKEPDDRWETCREFVAALRAELLVERHRVSGRSALPTGAVPAQAEPASGLIDRASSYGSPEFAEAAGESDEPRIGLHRPPTWALLVLALVVLIAAGGMVGYLRTRPSATSLGKHFAGTATVPISLSYPGSWVAQTHPLADGGFTVFGKTNLVGLFTTNPSDFDHVATMLHSDPTLVEGIYADRPDLQGRRERDYLLTYFLRENGSNQLRTSIVVAGPPRAVAGVTAGVWTGTAHLNTQAEKLRFRYVSIPPPHGGDPIVLMAFGPPADFPNVDKIFDSVLASARLINK